METRHSLKEMILNEIDNQPRGYAEILAPISGYNNGSALKKPLKDEKRDFDNFNGLVNLVKFLFPNDELKLMEEYSKTLDPCNKSARIMLEYLSSHKLLDSLEELIDKMAECKNKESKEWSKLYRIQLEWSANYYDLDILEILKTLNEFKTNIPELNTLISIMKCNSYYKQKMYKMALELSKDIPSIINDIKDDFVKSAYMVKFNEIMSYLSLRVCNDSENARKYAENVLTLNIGQTFNAYAKYIIGFSYFFTSYEKAKESLNDSVKIYESLHRHKAAIDVKEELELLDVVWDKDVFSVYYCEKYRYYWMARKEIEFNINCANLDLDDPFYYLIKGMKENNNNALLQSIIRFVKRGDMFLANLSRIELLKRSCDEDVINDLLNMYVA